MACERESHLETWWEAVPWRVVEAASVTPQAAACVMPVFWAYVGVCCVLPSPQGGGSVCWAMGLGAAGMSWWVSWDLLP